MKSFRFLAILIASTCFVVGASVSTAGEVQDEKPKILLLTHSQGFKHGSLPVAERVMKKMAKESGAFEVVSLEGYRQEREAIDLSMISAEYLAQYDAVMFYTTGELPLDDSQKKALIDFVKGGKAYIGTHSATDTFYTWKGYGELSGAYFSGHGPNHLKLILKIEDKHHPATEMLGDSWEIADEFYRYGKAADDEKRPVPYSRDRLHVLMSVDTERSDLSRQSMEKGGDYALAWCQNFGEGRSFYTALGHRDDVWENPVYQQHLLGGILWALGLKEGDASPSGKK